MNLGSELTLTVSTVQLPELLFIAETWLCGKSWNIMSSYFCSKVFKNIFIRKTWLHMENHHISKQPNKRDFIDHFLEGIGCTLITFTFCSFCLVVYRWNECCLAVSPHLRTGWGAFLLHAGSRLHTPTSLCPRTSVSHTRTGVKGAFSVTFTCIFTLTLLVNAGTAVLLLRLARQLSNSNKWTGEQVDHKGSGLWQ